MDGKSAQSKGSVQVFILAESSFLPQSSDDYARLPTVGLEFDLSINPLRRLTLPSEVALHHVRKELETKMDIPVQKQRIWRWLRRENDTFRPQELETDISQCTETEQEHILLYVQDITPTALVPATFSEEEEDEELPTAYILFKWLNPASGKFQFIGATEVDQDCTLSQVAENIILPLLPNKHEIKASELQLVDEENAAQEEFHALDQKQTLRELELQDGDIICVSSDPKCEVTAALKALHRSSSRPSALSANLDSQWFITAQEANSVTLPASATDMSGILNNPEFADVVFTFADGTEEMYAHKVVLALKSEYFATMFRSSFKEGRALAKDDEKITSGLLQIELKDASEPAFRILLQHLYGQSSTVSLKEDFELLCQVAELANRFLVQSLELTALLRLEHFININTCLRLLCISCKLSSQKLKSLVLQFIAKNCIKVANLPDFEQLCKTDPETADMIVAAIAQHWEDEDCEEPAW